MAEALQQLFCRLRPVMHTGYEAIPLMFLIERGKERDADIMADFSEFRDRFLDREHLSAEKLRQVFGNARDQLAEKDRAAWLEWNRFYPGIREILSAAIQRHAVYIITTKQERFVPLLLRHNGIELPDDRIFGLERNRSKPEI